MLRVVSVSLSTEGEEGGHSVTTPTHTVTQALQAGEWNWREGTRLDSDNIKTAIIYILLNLHHTTHQHLDSQCITINIYSTWGLYHSN